MTYSLLTHKPYAESQAMLGELRKRFVDAEEKIQDLQDRFEKASAAAESLSIDALLDDGAKSKARAAQEAANEIQRRLKEAEADRHLLAKGLERLSKTAGEVKEAAGKLLREKAGRDHQRVVQRIAAALGELSAACEEEAAIRDGIAKALGLKSAPGNFVAIKGTDVDPGARDNRYSNFGWLVKRLRDSGYEV